MTVINAMKFNEREGGMVADSQISSQLQKYDIAEKVTPIKAGEDTIALLGGSGNGNFLHEATSSLREYVQIHPQEKVDDLARVLSEITLRMKREIINNYLRSVFDVNNQAALSGHILVEGNLVQINSPKLKNDIEEAHMGHNLYLREILNNEFLLVGRSGQGTKIYCVQTGTIPILGVRPYAIIGSENGATAILYQFIKNMKREQRNNINPVEGMSALIRATNASSDFNQGVGGVPTISRFGPEGIIFLEEDESRLASELVRARDAGLVADDLHYNCLEQLLTKKACFEEVEKKAFREKNNYDQIMHLLRGYK